MTTDERTDGQKHCSNLSTTVQKDLSGQKEPKKQAGEGRGRGKGGRRRKDSIRKERWIRTKIQEPTFEKGEGKKNIGRVGGL